MKPHCTLFRAQAARFSYRDGDRELARTYLYLIKNDLHDAPYGLIEDVFVAPDQRGQGLAKKLLLDVIAAARKQGCYKLIACSREGKPEVHALYEKLGFSRHGFEFRMDFSGER